MVVEQIYTGCLAEASYYIESDGEAVIIDPLRESQPYLDKLAKANVRLKYIFETHFHADFVSGHLDLSEKTGATIIYGPNANPDFVVNQMKDGDEISVGKLKFKVLHTPGHTLESTCYLLFDENGKEKALFTGDTLFIGDVGRPDLAIDNGLEKEDLAKMMYASLREKIMVLPDDIVIYPAHGAGSACGKNMSDDTFDTLGNQKKTNYALRANMTEGEFINEVLDGMTPPPEYFALNAMLNKQGYDALEGIMNRGITAHNVEDFAELLKDENIVLIDTRHQQVFKFGFIPGSLFFGLNGSFAPWVGSVLKDVNKKILFVADSGKEKEVVKRLARVGFDNVLGFIDGGVNAWQKSGRSIDSIKSIKASELEKEVRFYDINLIDVRKPSEFEVSAVKDVENFPLDYIEENIHKLDKNKQYHVYCRSGYRSMVFASMLKKEGFKDPIDISGGFNAIKETPGFSLVEGACCS